MSKPFRNLRSLVDFLRSENELAIIEAEVSPDLELAEIHRRVAAQQGKALLFTNVRGSKFPLVSNLYGTEKRVRVAFRQKNDNSIEKLVELLKGSIPPPLPNLWACKNDLWSLANIGTKNRNWVKGVSQNRLQVTNAQGLFMLPAIKQWPDDGGRFLTLPLVYTEDVESKTPNLGMYRIQFFSNTTTGMHWQIHRGGGFHYHKAELLRKPLPVSIFLGGPPLLTLAAIAPLPENISELILCSFLLGEKLITKKIKGHPHPILTDADFAIQGYVDPFIRQDEGPFGDHFGYYSLKHKYPVFRAERMFYRSGAIFPATIVGKPRQEDFYIGEYLNELFFPLLKIVIPGLEALQIYGDSGFHAIGAAKVKNRYWQEAMANAFRILGEGQLSLQKMLIVTDTAPNLKDFKLLLQHVLERSDWEKDLFIFSNVSQDTLDYTGPKLNEGSKVIWLGLGEAKYQLQSSVPQELPNSIKNAAIFVPGCLVVEMESYGSLPNIISSLREAAGLSLFRMVVVVDSLKEVFAKEQNFLWILGTRVEPAHDIFSLNSRLERYHVKQSAPLFFDARMKPNYPPTVEVLEETHALVSRRWHEYFGAKSPF